MFYVYLIRNMINGKVYIGKTDDPPLRWRRHIKTAREGLNNKSFSAIHRAIEKYGVENFELSILETLDDELSALTREEYWIKFYKSNARRYGNDFGYNLTDGGEGMSGYKHTDAAKLLCSNYKKTHPNTPETNLKISQANKGREFSPEHRQKLSSSGRGERNTNAKLDAARVSLIKEMLRNGISGAEIARQFGVSEATIHNIKIGKSWTHVK